eukprot:CAMPEP_0113509444 /NCGR_PEP_ID=MMETSP0014_2-20120614/37581_1 /TAXON_ID=2857 /ORGANISM="Nitzschia sp." /LENGTH=821 /DNA_ID=CAMNT_0000405279 /DNA_START=59 /DNA_END=2527 /DNA_ORIENTATION=- /assembly_acc=CAM_ASM_000159
MSTTYGTAASAGGGGQRNPVKRSKSPWVGPQMLLSCYGSINSQVEVGQQQQTPAATATSSRITEQDLTWRDFWKPPRSNKSILTLVKHSGNNCLKYLATGASTVKLKLVSNSNPCSNSNIVKNNRTGFDMERFLDATTFQQVNTDTGKALRQQLSQVSCYGSINSQVEVGQQQQTPAATATSSRITEQDLTWRDFWMPPRSNKSILTLVKHSGNNCLKYLATGASTVKLKLVSNSNPCSNSNIVKNNRTGFDMERFLDATTFQQVNTDTGKALRQQLSQVSCYGSINSQVEVGQQQQTPAATATSSRITEQDLTWRDFWMPPRSNKSILSLPFSHHSRLDTHWEDTYTVESSTVRTWTEDVLFESFRHLLEASDGCQGVSIMTQGQGIYAGLTSVLLDEIQQECKSAGRLVYNVINPAEVAAKSSAEDNPSSSTADVPTTTTSTEDDDEDMYATSTSWQQANIRRVRTQIGSGMALHDFSEKAHVVLPLHLDHSLGSLFRSSAQLAIALEASSLPLRLRGGNNNKSRDYSIGLQNAPFFGTGGDDVRWGTTASSLTVTEYISMLRPSSSHPVLELDAVCNNKLTKSELWSAIRSGTSIERDDRMRHSGEIALRGRPQDTQPGTWLGDSHNNTSPPGLLSSLSYTPEISKSVSNRSEHHHFTLSSAARPVLFDSTTSNEVAQYGSSPISDCLSCFIQGMGIRYRPQRSMVTLVDQSIGSLTFDGDGSGYGAGVYWKNLLSSGDCPVVSVVGNTTRSYVSLRATATNMKTSMGPRNRGYMNRDIMNGILPEKEDCEEALSRVWDLCDTYAPPSGSGYDSDASG